jgi:hypothetical protein
MAKYRVLEATTYVADGAVVSVKAGRVVELSDDQAQSLAGKVAPLEERNSMFPDGNPVIGSHITRVVPPVAPAGDPVEPAPTRAHAPRVVAKTDHKADSKSDSKKDAN